MVLYMRNRIDEVFTCNWLVVVDYKVLVISDAEEKRCRCYFPKVKKKKEYLSGKKREKKRKSNSYPDCSFLKVQRDPVESSRFPRHRGCSCHFLEDSTGQVYICLPW